MKIAYLCQYFPPEIGAPAARVSEMSAAWVAQGHEVTVITGLPNHPTGRIPDRYRGVRFCEEQLGGVRVWRNWLYATPNEGFLKKTLSHLSFMVSAAVLSTHRLRDADVIVVSSPTFFSVITAWFMSRVRRVPYVFEVRDLWPGIFVELGVLKNRWLIAVLEAVEMFLYRGAARVVVVTDAFADNLRRRGVPAAKLATITNGVDADFFAPAPTDNSLRREHGLTDTFVALYIGAHGISHALSRVLDAVAATRDDGIHWVFVGEGAEKSLLMSRAKDMGLSNVTFLPGQPKELMPAWYAACDVALVPLRDIPLFEQFIPSKMFEIMSCERPIIGSVRGEARTILEASGSAITVNPEDAAAIAEAARQLKADPACRRRMGESGRRFVMAHFDRVELARRYAVLLQSVVDEHRG